MSIWKNEKEIKRLTDTVNYIGKVLYDVEGRKQFKEESVTEGYKRLREAFLDAEDFLDRVETIKKKKEAEVTKMKQVGLFFSISNQAKYALKVNNGIRKIRKNLDANSQDLQKFGLRELNSSSDAAHMTARASGSYVDVTQIIGRDEDKRKIVDLMLRSSVEQNKIPVILIVGIGGMGKTTAGQLVYDDKSLQESCKFDRKLWVSDSKSLLKHIPKSIYPGDTSLDFLEVDHLSDQLVKEIGGKRFLLVLDDVQKEDPWIWEKMEELLNRGSKESRILITTRSRKVAGVVGSSGSIYELQGL